jgi:hypothetical protein
VNAQIVDDIHDRLLGFAEGRDIRHLLPKPEGPGRSHPVVRGD